MTTPGPRTDYIRKGKVFYCILIHVNIVGTDSKKKKSGDESLYLEISSEGNKDIN